MLSFLFLLLLLGQVLGKTGSEQTEKAPFYMLSTPKILFPGTLHKFLLSLNKPLLQVRIDTFEPVSNRSVSGTPLTVQPGSTTIPYTIPIDGKFTSLNLTLIISKCRLQKRPSPVHCIQLQKRSFQIAVRRKSLSLFIEVAAPTFRPGAYARFRVLALNLQTLHLSDDSVNVFLEGPAPGRFVLAQWKNLTSRAALQGMRFLLSNDAQPGSYSIVAESGKLKQKRPFSVEKFVLPRFRIDLHPPNHLFVSDKQVKFAVCAEYHNKAPIPSANVSAELCVKSNWPNRALKRPCIFVTGSFSAPNRCANFTEPTDILQLGNSTFQTWRQFVFLNASVLESGAAKSLWKSQWGGPLEVRPFRLINRSPRHFAMNLPYYGLVLVEKGDGTPVAGVVLTVRVETSWRGVSGSTWGFEENYSSDAEGRVEFAIPPFPTGRPTVVIVVTPARPEGAKKRRSSRAWLWILARQVFSAGGFGLQLLPSKELGDVCKAGKLRLQLQANVPLHNKVLHVLSTARANIRTSQSFGHSKPQRCRHRDSRELGHFHCVRPAGAEGGPPMVKCISGWTGLNCAVPTCPSGCFRGACVSPGRCRCHRGWTNANCRKCVIRPGCVNGFCKEGDDCVCMAGYEGWLCNKLSAGTSSFRNWLFPFLPLNTLSENWSSRRNDLPPIGSQDSLQTFHIFSRQIEVSISPNMFPAGHLTIWMLVPSAKGDEIVSTSIHLPDLTSCLAQFNPTSFSFTNTVEGPGENVTASIVSSGANRLCALSIVDSALEAFGPRGTVTTAAIRTRIQTWSRNLGWTRYLEPSMRRRCSPWRSFRRHVFGALDGRWAFRRANLIALSSATFASPTCSTFRFRTTAAVDASESTDVATGAPSARIRSFFPDTWVFDLLQDPDPQLPLTVPDSLTQWRASMFCVTSRGLGISPPALLHVRLAFSLSMLRPYSLIRGERVELKVKVLSYREHCTAVRIGMVPTPELEVISARNTSGCVCRFQELIATFLVLPKVLGKVPVVASAVSTGSNACGSPEGTTKVSDAVRRQILVEPEGLPRTLTMGHVSCALNGETRVTNFTADDFLNINRSILVPDSARAYLGWSGNLLGFPIKNLDNLLVLPTGCGEQNMVRLVPSIAVLDFLKKSGLHKPDIESKAKEMIGIGVQRQLRYRHPDGSFSGFGPGRGHNGSTFLTAFVYKSFSAAALHVTIDGTILSGTLAFLMTKLNNATGCFREDGRVFNYMLKGGLSASADDTSLTAYVLAALLESTQGNPSLASILETPISRAVSCIKAGLASSSALTNTSTYGVAIRAYALTLWNSSDIVSVRLRDELQRRVIREGMTEHWSPGSAPAPPLYFWNRYSAGEVETTAYVLLAHLSVTPRFSVASFLPSVRWLTAAQTEYGGWFGTQDTVVAFAALARFSELLNVGAGLNLMMDLQAPGGVLVHRAFITKANELVFSQMAVSPNQTLWAKINGTGCLMLHRTLLFNIRAPITKIKAFALSVSTHPQGSACKSATVKVCVRFLLLDNDGVSNMALLTLKMPSGWRTSAATKTALERLQSPGGLQKVEEREDMTLVLYFDRITAKNTCWSFHLEEIMRVENLQPMIVEAWDYYKPDKRVEALLRVCP